MGFNQTDAVVFLLIFYFAFKGWRKGFLRSLNGPIAVVLCMGLGYLYFQKTQNVLLCLGIAIFGPLALNVVLGLVLDILQKADQQSGGASSISRLLGLLISLGWSGSILLLSIFLLSIMPAQLFGMEKVRENIRASGTYALIIENLPKPKPVVPADKAEEQATESQEEVSGDLIESEEFKTLMSDPRIQAVFKDEETMKQIKAQDFVGLLNNPKIFAIVQDPKLLKAFLEMHKKIQEYGLESKTTKSLSP